MNITSPSDVRTSLNAALRTAGFPQRSHVTAISSATPRSAPSPPCARPWSSYPPHRSPRAPLDVDAHGHVARARRASLLELSRRSPRAPPRPPASAPRPTPPSAHHHLQRVPIRTAGRPPRTARRRTQPPRLQSGVESVATSDARFASTRARTASNTKRLARAISPNPPTRPCASRRPRDRTGSRDRSSADYPRWVLTRARHPSEDPLACMRVLPRAALALALATSAARRARADVVAKTPGPATSEPPFAVEVACANPRWGQWGGPPHARGPRPRRIWRAGTRGGALDRGRGATVDQGHVSETEGWV